MSAVSLPDAKLFLNKTDTNDDAEIQAMLERAEAVLARRIGPISLATVTDEVHTGPGPLVLRSWPALSVTSVTDSGVAVTDYEFDQEPGLLYGAFSRNPRAIKVTYVTGRDALPPDLEEAVLEMLRHLWKSQRGGGSARPSFPGEGDSATAPPADGYLLPYRVQSLIEPYLLRTVA